jgi:hypothetical protein
MTAQEGEQLLPDGNTRSWSMVNGGRRLLTKMETTLKNKCTFSNPVVKFWEAFTCLTGKQHEKEEVSLSELYMHVHQQSPHNNNVVVTVISTVKAHAALISF